MQRRARGYTALGQGWLSLDRDLVLPDFANPARKACPPYGVPLGAQIAMSMGASVR